ncbi:MAG: bifunctional diaminohydroxyphosphoribosylaminopyrimidine deaminase/5-amino-6-(5-phosphoribosylamino)uracil reductase RibD [Hyphomicrobiales bacterium]
MAVAVSSCALSKHERLQNELLNDVDHAFLQASIRLGLSRIGLTSPNPSVGALIVQFDEAGPVVVGRGVTADGGRPHGEVVALTEAGERARGATCYVSLEPCAHHGRTPPCVDALMRAGVSRVVIAMDDPDSRVSGKGAAFLRDAGIEVYENVATHEAKRANLGHVLRIEKARPAIALKLAVSVDGMIGREGEGMVAITGPLARRAVHAMRARADAVLVGIGTVLADDPDLTCRLPGMSKMSSMRVILDSDARTPLSAKLFETIDNVPVMVFVAESADTKRQKALEDKGAQIVRVACDDDGQLSLNAVMAHLAELNCTNVMVEGGATVAQSLLAQDLVDRVALFKGADEIGSNGMPALSSGDDIEGTLRKNGLKAEEHSSYGKDQLTIWERA